MIFVMTYISTYYFRTKFLSDDWMMERDFIDPEADLDENSAW